MAKTNQTSSIASAYASALLDLANEKKQAEPIAEELAALRQIITENRTFGLFLSDPGISGAERGAVMSRILGGKLSPLLQNFLGVLNSKDRLSALPAIADAYDDLLAEQLGKIEVDVTVAKELSAEQLEEVKKKVSSALKKDAVVHQHVDDSIIGGMILRVQDKLIDASVKTQLAAMKEQLLTAGTK
jgi:F-type H+-transporting ATPase subunit delta